jgi:dolichol-phosphate mannosyltransferase
MMKQQLAGVLINLPVLNEIEHIEQLLHDIDANLNYRPYTVCLIDDGSTDGTVEKIRELMNVYPNHLHLIQRVKTVKGCQRGSALYAGLKWGIKNTDHTIFIEMDGDLSHRAVELKTGIHLVEEEGYDVAIASKFMQGGQVLNRPIGRRLVSLLGSFIVRLLLTYRIKDYSNGYRFYSREAAEILTRYKIKYGNPIYLSEVMAIWLKNRMRVMEFASIYLGRNEGLSKVIYKDLVKAFFAIFEIAYRYYFEGFEPIDGDEKTIKK